MTLNIAQVYELLQYYYSKFEERNVRPSIHLNKIISKERYLGVKFTYQFSLLEKDDEGHDKKTFITTEEFENVLKTILSEYGLETESINLTFITDSTVGFNIIAKEKSKQM